MSPRAVRRVAEILLLVAIIFASNTPGFPRPLLAVTFCLMALLVAIDLIDKNP